MSKNVRFVNLGEIDYKEAWDYQEELFDQLIRRKGKGEQIAPEDTAVIFCEHPHVYTLGKSGEQQNLLITDELLERIGATYYRINRGGDITYHGPGQLVGYPIIDLEMFHLQVKQYIYKLEESIIRTLAHFGLKTERLEGATGVWIDTQTPDARKICAMGVRASRFVTMHGFALNVHTDLSYFQHINPCGFVDKGVTSMQKELGKPIAIPEVSPVLKKQLEAVFGMELS
ncbi:MAG: lipoyl(octanoyl) transferase LipB [Bacteroidales bacterium]|jgi:lipoyl(octanoyl) transferase